METKQPNPNKLETGNKKGLTGFENERPVDGSQTDSTPGQTWEGADVPSDENQPHQSGRDSTAAGGKPGYLGNLPPSQNRPFTEVGRPDGGSRNPNVK